MSDHGITRKASVADMVAYYTEILADRDRQEAALKAQRDTLAAALRQLADATGDLADSTNNTLGQKVSAARRDARAALAQVQS